MSEEDVRKDKEAKRPESPPAELKRNPHDLTVANKKDLERFKTKKEAELG